MVEQKNPYANPPEQVEEEDENQLYKGVKHKLKSWWGTISEQANKLRSTSSSLGPSNNAAAADQPMDDEEVKMGEECDGFEIMEEIVSSVIAANNIDVQHNPADVSLDELMKTIISVLEQVKQKVLQSQKRLFMRDERTPNPDEEPVEDSMVELAQSMALGHFNQTFREQLGLIQECIVIIVEQVQEDTRKQKASLK